MKKSKAEQINSNIDNELLQENSRNQYQKSCIYKPHMNFFYTLFGFFPFYNKFLGLPQEFLF